MDNIYAPTKRTVEAMQYVTDADGVAIEKWIGDSKIVHVTTQHSISGLGEPQKILHYKNKYGTWSIVKPNTWVVKKRDGRVRLYTHREFTALYVKGEEIK